MGINLKCILLFISLLSSTLLMGIQFPYKIMRPADTADSEKQEVIALWLDYLDSRPDLIRNNPHWNAEEKLKFADFDFARQFLYPAHSRTLMQHFAPIILSVDKDGDAYKIRTQFNTDVISGSHRSKKKKPTILTMYAIEENGQWKLKNALTMASKNWKRTTVGSITFVYSVSHEFDGDDARRSNAFYVDLAKEFNADSAEPFDYYITGHVSELETLLGIEGFFHESTAGMAMSLRRILFSGNGSEWYPHEVAHMVFAHDTLHSMLNEGFATWQGGAMSRSFQDHALKLGNAARQDPSLKFMELADKEWGETHAAYYTAGAILLKEVYDQFGIEGLKLMLDAGRSNEDLAETIMTIFQLKPDELDGWFRKIIGSYGDQNWI